MMLSSLSKMFHTEAMLAICSSMNEEGIQKALEEGLLSYNAILDYLRTHGCEGIKSKQYFNGETNPLSAMVNVVMDDLSEKELLGYIEFAGSGGMILFSSDLKVLEKATDRIERSPENLPIILPHMSIKMQCDTARDMSPEDLVRYIHLFIRNTMFYKEMEVYVDTHHWELADLSLQDLLRLLEYFDGRVLDQKMLLVIMVNHEDEFDNLVRTRPRGEYVCLVQEYKVLNESFCFDDVDSFRWIVQFGRLLYSYSSIKNVLSDKMRTFFGTTLSSSSSSSLKWNSPRESIQAFVDGLD